MAELCLDCFNEIFKKTLTEKDVKVCKDFCEGCGELKDCVIYVKRDEK